MGELDQLGSAPSEQLHRRSSWLLPLLAAALAGMGAGSFLVGSSLQDADASVVAANQPINRGASDKRVLATNNSPALARNPADPANLAVVNRIDTPQFSCGLHASFDGGATWTETKVPFPAGEELPERCFAPDIAFGADGTMYVSFVTLKGRGNTPNAAWLVSSPDGGRTLSAPHRMSGQLAFQVRLLADPAEPGRLYRSWLQAAETGNFQFANPGNPIQVARSDDGGVTWLDPVTVTPPARRRPVAPSMAAGPRGELYLLYLDLVDDALDYHGGHEGKGGEPYLGSWTLVLARSLDKGATWKEAVVDDTVVPTERFVVFLPPFPSLAVDQGSGRVYASFHDGRSGDADVWLWASEDRGASFRSPRRVNDTRRRDGTRQYLPKVAVAPGGRVDIVYYDRRSDAANVMNEVSLQSSGDEGRTFTDRVRLSDRPFDSRIGFGAEREMPDLGSRLALVSTDRRALAVWADTRGGSDVASKQDLARAVVAFAPASRWRQPLRFGGVALGMASVVVLLFWGVFRGRGS